jgi:hypothetical protein
VARSSRASGQPLDDLILVRGALPARLAALPRPSGLTPRPSWPSPRSGIALRMPRPTRPGVAVGLAPPASARPAGRRKLG